MGTGSGLSMYLHYRGEEREWRSAQEDCRESWGQTEPQTPGEKKDLALSRHVLRRVSFLGILPHLLHPPASPSLHLLPVPPRSSEDHYWEGTGDQGQPPRHFRHTGRDGKEEHLNRRLSPPFQHRDGHVQIWSLFR